MTTLRSSRKPRLLLLLRTLFQLGIVGAALTVGIRYSLGLSLTSIERYCPFGGFETAWSLFTRQRFSCSAGETNLALFAALVGLTFAARKAFCSWVCPVGAVSEGLARIAGRLRWEPSPKLDRALRWLRVPMLAGVLFFTWKTGELIFRGFDPFYILFSIHGHDVKTWSYIVLAVVLGGSLIIPLAWCRYLCPLGAALWPLSRVGRLRLVRNEARCTGCRACDRRCLHGLTVSRSPEVNSGECTLCLECLHACPIPAALELRTGKEGR